jgi:hypothetical protein
MKEPQCSIFLWLLDLCLDVSANSATNKMTPQNLAIVIGWVPCFVSCSPPVILVLMVVLFWVD